MHIRYGEIREELEVYQSLWEEQGIENYQYILRITNTDGSAAVAVKVEDGRSSIAKRLESRYRGEVSEILPMDIEYFNSIPDLFDRIVQSLEDREENGTMKLIIRYDEDRGYPVYIALYSRSFDYNSLYSYSVSDFKVLESSDIRYARYEESLNQYDKLWESQEISDYDYTLVVRTSEFDSRVRVVVRNGTASVVEPSGRMPEDIETLDTIQGLFSRIRQAITGREEEGFNQLQIRYNDVFGYPVYIALRDSYITGDPGVYSYSITDFQTLD
jgi:hypothetical protein